MKNGSTRTWEEAVAWLKSQPDRQDLVRSCFFDDPLNGAAARYHSSSEWIAIRRLIGLAGGAALDIGSGRGISAYALAKDGWKTTALEPDPSQIVGAGAIRALAVDSGMSIEVVETWGESLPFPDRTFELVHVRQALHHAHDLQQLCREIARVLKPQGHLIATREHVLSKARDLTAFLNIHPLHELYGGEHAYELSTYTSAIESAGIRLTKTLNPLESDINAYPKTLGSIRQEYAEKLHLPAYLIPDLLLAWRGRFLSEPGRLYSFFGYKK